MLLGGLGALWVVLKMDLNVHTETTSAEEKIRRVEVR
jgi:hypothetical protein